MTRTEISRVTNDVKNRIMADVRHQLTELFGATGVSVDEFANHIGMDSRQLRALLGGNQDISLDAFVKIMIATNNVIEIHPRINPKQNTRPSSRARHPFPMMGLGDPRHLGGMMPPKPFMEAPQQPRPCERPNANELTETVAVDNDCDMELHRLTRNELIGRVVANGWDNEIDVRRATRTDLIDFIERKTPLQDTVEEFVDNNDFVMPMDVEETERRNDEAADIAAKLTEMIMSNPQLKEKLAPFIR